MLWEHGVAGSNPVIPTICPCDVIGNHHKLRPYVCRFESCQGYAGMEQQRLGRFIPYTSASAILAPVTKNGSVA
jgi:hypothetical protein